MNDVVIRAEGLGKKYVIGHQTGERYTALRDVPSQQVRRLLRSARDMAAGRALVAGDEREEFWALKDVNFEIKRGEVVGIIGRNGAGKSTLLKVLSRITEPTEGRVTISGRVASLLEVGTGFHPELTGRENIYLNGAILGMTRAEIKRKFDEIVYFAGVEKFLDTPVKRYSSGMYVRLAFSVAAHLESEILVVDEVLAVGDAEFQKKCLGKMQDLAGGGRTVLFVSHNIAAINALCSAALVLESGRVRYSGEINGALKLYMKTLSGSGEIAGLAKQVANTPADPLLRFRSVSVKQNGQETLHVAANSEFEVRLDFEVMAEQRALRVFVDMYDQSGTLVLRTFSDERENTQSDFSAGDYSAKLTFPANYIQPGGYTVVVRAAIYQVRTIAGYPTFDGPGIPFGLQIEGPTDLNAAYPSSRYVGLLVSKVSWAMSSAR